MCPIGAALTDDIAVPDGHYAEETMRVTVVPNRNAIMLTIALERGERR
jgi:7-cyano-7-deazaguanine synthase